MKRKKEEEKKRKVRLIASEIRLMGSARWIWEAGKDLSDS